MRSETQIIELLERAMRRGRASRVRRASWLRLGIGDDAAVLTPRRGRELVLTTDAFLERVHFLGNVHPPEAVGWKALARATSDLAAMGARPLAFLLTLALPPARTADWLPRFARGMARAARAFHLTLIGGDTARSDAVAISLTVLGEVAPSQFVRRSGAQAGDALFVTGTLGRAQLGLEIVLAGMAEQPRWRRLLQPHFYPHICLAAGEWLAGRRMASAMIDTSDGLSTDLHRLCAASRVGARVFAARLPAARIPEELRPHGWDATALALHGGEDYQLLFTAPPRAARRMPRRIAGHRVTRIGQILPGRDVTLLDASGSESPLPAAGWQHFRQG